MAIGRDRGERHCVALSRVATGNNASMGDNHTVPVLQQIVHNDMTFAVFPLMSTGFVNPWYYCFSEVLDAVEQILEVTIFHSLFKGWCSTRSPGNQFLSRATCRTLSANYRILSLVHHI